MRIALIAILIGALCLATCAGVGLMQLGSSGDFVGFSFHLNDGQPFLDVPMISTGTLFGAGVAIVCGSVVLLTFLLLTFRIRRCRLP